MFQILLFLLLIYFILCYDKKMKSSKKIIGIATIGKKGQIVIPLEARNLLKLKKGEKLIVMMAHKNSLAIIKSSEFEAIAKSFTKNINLVRKMIKK